MTSGKGGHYYDYTISFDNKVFNKSIGVFWILGDWIPKLPDISLGKKNSLILVKKMSNLHLSWMYFDNKCLFLKYTVSF